MRHARFSLLAATLLAAALLLSACASRPWPFSAASTTTPAAPPWWQALNDPALNDLMATLEGQNLTVQIAVARLTEAQAQATAATGALFPRLDVTGNASRGERGVPTRTGTLEGGLQANYEVDLFGTTRNTAAAARLRAAQAAESVADARRLVRAELAQTVVEQRSRVAEQALLQALVSNTQALESLQAELARVGLSAPDAVSQAAAQTATAQQRLELATAATAATGFQLARLLAQSATVVLPAAPMVTPSPSAVLEVSLTQLQARPDVAAARLGYLASERDAAAAEAALWPRLTLGAFFGAQESTAITMPLASNPVWALSAGLTAPVLNFGQLRGAAKAAQARATAATLTYQETTNRALAEARTALSDYLAGVNAATAANLAEQRQTAAAATVAERARRGLASRLTALNAANAQLEQALQTVAAERNARNAYITLWTTLGQ
ncbi:MAG: TolC family protein [Alphaproteobacteria bacterium]|nr:TolC family protein [Alphaproteobacteria bacterium]